MGCKIASESEEREPGLEELLGGSETPPPVHTPWQGHRTGLEMILGGKFHSGEGFLMEVATAPKLESNQAWQQVAVCWYCG